MGTHTSAQPRHGAVTEPASRAALRLEAWQANGLEAGKFFPATESGLNDPYAPDDTVNAAPPADGRIASAGKDFAALLDEARSDWPKHPVSSGQAFTLTWSFHAPHKTRRYNYFLTRQGWDTSSPLTRGQFEPHPIHTHQNTCQPFWSCDDLLPADPTTHEMVLPQRTGYHVLLAVWEVADTPNAFYQVIDLEFT
jgi:chitin-binding protein